MPDIIFYIVTGFFFTSVFNFTALQKRTSDIEHILTSSLVTGYVICKIMEAIPFSVNPVVDSFGIAISAIILGYFLGYSFQNKQLFYTVCEKLGLRNSVTDCIWDDILDFENQNKLIIYTDDKIISGYIHYLENHNNAPTVSLAGYLIQDRETLRILNDSRHSYNKVIYFDLSKADYVEVEYYSKSKMCYDVKTLSDNNE